MSEHQQFEIALSFARPQRPLVKAVYEWLVKWGVSTFYDEAFEVELWGEDLKEKFLQIYGEGSKYAVPFISEAYVQGPWTNVERRAMQQISLNPAHILPFQLDASRLPGMPDTVCYISAVGKDAYEMASLIYRKVRCSHPPESAPAAFTIPQDAPSAMVQASSPNIGRKIEEQPLQSVHSVLPTLSPSVEQVSPAMNDVDEKMYILVLADEAFLGGRHLRRGDVVLAEGDGLQLLLEYKKVRYLSEPKVTVGINNEKGVMYKGKMLRYKSIHDLPRKDAVELLSQPKSLVCMLDPTTVVLKALKPMKVPGYRYLPGKLFFAPESKALEYEAKGEAKIMGR